MVDVSKLKVGDRFIITRGGKGINYEPTSYTYTIVDVLTSGGVPISFMASCPYTVHRVTEWAVDELEAAGNRLKLIDPVQPEAPAVAAEPAAAPTDGAE